MIKASLHSFAQRISVPGRKRSGPMTFNANRTKIELLAGLTVALALVPEAVAFAFVAGVEPLVGLYAAFIVGLITALIGGRPGMISGATGALAVVMVALVAQHGVEYLFATVILMGILQIMAGIFRLGKFIRIESLLTLNLVGEIKEERGGASQECVAAHACPELAPRCSCSPLFCLPANISK